MIRTARWMPVLAVTALMLVAAACGGGGAAAGATSGSSPASGAGTPAAATASPAASSAASPASTAGASSAAGSAGGNDRCPKFSTAQVTTLTGAPFQTSGPEMLDVPGCQWYFNSGVGNIQLQILPGAQYTDWSGKTGVTALSGVGDKAFVGPYVLGGTMAGALVGDTFYFLTVAPEPSQDAIVTFLKLAIAQGGGQ